MLNEIAIIGMQRTGTTVLSRLLGSDRGTFVCGEIFHPGAPDRESYQAFADRMAQDRGENVLGMAPAEVYDSFIDYIRMVTGARTIGVNVKYSSLHRLNPTWHSLSARPAIIDIFKRRAVGIIHLVRRDVISVALSNCLATATGRWHIVDPDPRPIPKVFADIARIDQIVSLYGRELEAFNAVIGDYPYQLTLYYEDMFENGIFSEKFISKLEEFTGGDCSFDRVPQLAKVMPIDPADAFSNWDEIQAFIASRRIHSFVPGAG